MVDHPNEIFGIIYLPPNTCDFLGLMFVRAALDLPLQTPDRVLATFQFNQSFH